MSTGPDKDIQSLLGGNPGRGFDTGKLNVQEMFPSRPFLSRKKGGGVWSLGACHCGALAPCLATNLDLYENTQVLVKSLMTRGDKPRDIFHLQGRNFTVPACQSPGTHTGLNHPPHLQEGGLADDAAKPFIMFSPETAVVPTDLTPGRRVCHQPSRPI